MSRGGSLARIFRGWVRLVCVVASLAAIAAPSALGAAMGPVLRELGAATQEHVCKCGMPRGTCGCPECDLLELERRAGHVPDAVPSLKRHCDDDGSAVPFTATAVAIVPAQIDVFPPAPRDAGPLLLHCVPPGSPDLARSTPPPRSASV